jgi:hypothetical protein
LRYQRRRAGRVAFRVLRAIPRRSGVAPPGFELAGNTRSPSLDCAQSATFGGLSKRR